MQLRKLALMGMAACLPALSLACGDGADDPTATPTTSAAALSPTVESSAAPASPTAGFTPVAFDPEDQEYAARICTAFDAYSDAIADMLANDPAITSDVDKLLSEMEPILDQLQDDVRSADPPAALDPYHDAAFENVNALLSAVREGRIEELADFGTQLGVARPPKEIEDRVRSASIGVPECEGNSLFFAAAEDGG